MAELKGLHTCLPVKAPELQLAVGQPSTGGPWNSPKKYPMSKDKEAAAVRR